MYLLDPNVVSELRRPHPHPAVVGWIEQVAADELLLSAVTVGEIQAGIELTREQDLAKAGNWKRGSAPCWYPIAYFQ